MSTTLAARLRAETVDLPLRYDCELCGRPLEPVESSDGGSWSVRGLASHGRRKHKSVLCWPCFVAATRLLRGGADAGLVPNGTAAEPYPRPGWPEIVSGKRRQPGGKRG
jgi:hypothetical protein